MMRALGHLVHRSATARPEVNCGQLVALVGIFTRLAMASGAAASLQVATTSARSQQLDTRIEYSTYFGGTGDESATSIAVDSSGNVYVAGTTASTEFPGTPFVDRSLENKLDAFVAKFSPDGALIYSTLVGGDCNDEGNAIAIDEAGNAYLTGRSHICHWGTLAPGVLVAKVGPDGELIYLYTFGAPLADSSVGLGIAVDAEGHAYVTGLASGAGFPVTSNAFQRTTGDGFLGDGFVAKVNPAGTGLVYCTYLCGTGHESANAIALDAQRNVVVVGRTASHDFPTTNAFQATHPSVPTGETSFVSKLDSTGSHLIFSTYLGGTVGDIASGVAVDSEGNTYVTGESAGGNFPTTAGVIQPVAPFPLCFGAGICSDAFVAKFSPLGSLVFSTLLAGEGDDGGSGIAVNANGHIYVVGSTASLYFPIRRAVQSRNHGIGDLFVTVLNSNATRILFSSYLGGGRPSKSPSLTEGLDRGAGIALGPGGKIHLSGRTTSRDFPTTAGAFQTNGAAGECVLMFEPCGDSFFTRISPDGPVLLPTPNMSVTPIELRPGETFTASWAGIATPTPDDVLVLYTLGERSDSFIFLPTYGTMGMAEGSLDGVLPETVVPGSYELRLLAPNPEALPLLMTVARSEPLTVLENITLVPALAGGNILHVRVRGLRAGPYRVEAAERVNPADWQVVTHGVVASGDTAVFTESTDAERWQRFYRVSQ